MSRAKRLRRVEEAIREEGWSIDLCRRLMSETGASQRTIYTDRDVVIETLANEDKAELPHRRALFLAKLRARESQAAEAGQLGPSARMLGMEAQITGVDRPPAPEVEEDASLDSADRMEQLQALLKRVRRMARQAEADSSYVAASKLMQQEADILQQIEELEAQRRDAAREDEDDVQLEAALVQALAGLPDDMRARILASAG